MRISYIGVTVALVALFAAVLSPWAITALSPPAPTFEETVVDMASKLKDAAVAKAEGREYVAKADPQPSSVLGIYIPAVIGLAMVSICLGVIGVLREPARLPGVMAIALGFAALVAQWSIYLALVAIGVMLLMKVLDTLDMGLSLFDS